jgi:hypothetical protein
MMLPSKATFDGVEFELGQGVSCFGEYAIPDTPSKAVCVALHDEGEDLLSLRWLSVLLLAQGIPQLLVDLPGHGLSNGNMTDHFAAALRATQAFARSLGCSTVAHVAKGSTSHLMLLTEQPASSVAAVLVSPVAQLRDSAVQGTSWERVPKLALVPAGDPASAAFAECLVRDTHAWCLRANLAFGPKDDPISASAQTQIGSIAAKFLLEQIAFAEASQASGIQPGHRANATSRTPLQP